VAAQLVASRVVLTSTESVYVFLNVFTSSTNGALSTSVLSLFAASAAGCCKTYLHLSAILLGNARGQTSWLQTHRSRVRFPDLADFLSSFGSGTGSNQINEELLERKVAAPV
jgi:hypothetical protein